MIQSLLIWGLLSALIDETFFKRTFFRIQDFRLGIIYLCLILLFAQRVKTSDLMLNIEMPCTLSSQGSQFFSASDQ